MEMRANPNSENASLTVLCKKMAEQFSTVNDFQTLRVLIYTASKIFEQDAIMKFIEKALKVYKNVEIFFNVIENSDNEEVVK